MIRENTDPKYLKINPKSRLKISNTKKGRFSPQNYPTVDELFELTSSQWSYNCNSDIRDILSGARFINWRSDYELRFSYDQNKIERQNGMESKNRARLNKRRAIKQFIEYCKANGIPEDKMNQFILANK